MNRVHAIEGLIPLLLGEFIPETFDVKCATCQSVLIIQSRLVEFLVHSGIAPNIGRRRKWKSRQPTSANSLTRESDEVEAGRRGQHAVLGESAGALVDERQNDSNQRENHDNHRERFLILSY